MKRGFIAEMAEGFAHLGKEEFRLVSETEEGLGASEFFSGAGDLENFVRRHGVCAGVAGIAAEGAVSAVIAAEIGEREKNFARVSDDAGFEALFGGARGG